MFFKKSNNICFPCFVQCSKSVCKSWAIFRNNPCIDNFLINNSVLFLYLFRSKQQFQARNDGTSSLHLLLYVCNVLPCGLRAMSTVLLYNEYLTEIVHNSKKNSTSLLKPGKSSLMLKSSEKCSGQKSPILNSKVKEVLQQMKSLLNS